MQVQSKENIKIAYLIGDTTDSNTYYPVARLRDTASGTIISTANLTQDAGNTRRYTGSIQAPADSTGRGRWVDVTISLYDDALHTSLNQTYPEIVDSHIVQDRISAALLAAGATSRDTYESGGADIDYKRIRKMLEDFAKILAAEIKANKTEIPEQEELDQEALAIRLISGLHEAIAPQHEELKGLVRTVDSRVAGVATALPEIKAAMPNFEPVFSRFEQLGLSHEQVLGALGPAFLDIVQEILSKEFASFTQSASLFVPHVLRDHTSKPQPSTGGNGEPPQSRRKGAKEYHADAMLLMGQKP